MRYLITMAITMTVFILTLSPAPAVATLIGDVLTISTTTANTTPSTFLNVTVDGTVEATFIKTAPSVGDFLKTRLDIFAGGFLFEVENIRMPQDGVRSGFNIQITGVDWVNDPLNGVLTNVQLLSSLTGGALAQDITNLTFSDGFGLDSGSISFDWNNVASSNILPKGGTFGYEFAVTAQHQAPVPEPSTMLLMGSGLAGLLGWRWWSKTTT